MPQFTKDDWQRILRGLKSLEQDHREARSEAEARVADGSYEFRKEALQTSNFHAEELNQLSILQARIRRRASEIAEFSVCQPTPDLSTEHSWNALPGYSSRASTPSEE